MNVSFLQGSFCVYAEKKEVRHKRHLLGWIRAFLAGEKTCQ